MISRKIAILSVSVGAGHVRAAQALAETCRRLYPHHVVVEKDILELMPRPFRKLYRDAYLDLVGKAPKLFGWLYDKTDRPFHSDLLRKGIEKANSGDFYDFIDNFQPDLALCTHFLPASLIHYRKRKGRFAGALATVVTDFDVHGMWLGTPADHLFLAVDEARVYLRSFGLPEESMSVTGIPTHPFFADNPPRAEVAASLGLAADLPTVLLSSGGFGSLNVGDVLDALESLSTPVQVIAACGKNEELRRELSQRYASATCHVIGFTDRFDLYMACADVLLGKPGGLTTWESFMKGLAWVIVNPIPGQEERNTFHLLEEGVAVWAYEPRTLAYKLERLLGNRERMEQMRQRSRALARPEAAREILQRSLGLMPEP